MFFLVFYWLLKLLDIYFDFFLYRTFNQIWMRYGTKVIFDFSSIFNISYFLLPFMSSKSVKDLKFYQQLHIFTNLVSIFCFS